MRLDEIDLLEDAWAQGVPHEAFDLLRREAPVHWHPEPDGPGFWAVTRHADVVQASRDTATFSSELGGTFVDDQTDEALAQIRLTILNMDPPKHARYRRLVSRGLHAPDGRPARRDHREAGRAHRRRRGRPGRVRVRRGRRGQAAARDDLRDDRPARGRLAPHVRAVEHARRPATTPTSSTSPTSAESAAAEIYAYCDAVAADRRAQPPRRPDDRPGPGRGRGRAARRPRAQPVLRDPGGGGQRDHPQPDQPLDAGADRPPRRAPPPPGRPRPVAHRGRGDAALGHVDPQLPAHRHRRHRAERAAHRRRRQGRPVLHVGQPRRGRVRRPAPLRRRPHARTTTSPSAARASTTAWAPTWPGPRSGRSCASWSTASTGSRRPASRAACVPTSSTA